MGWVGGWLNWCKKDGKVKNKWGHSHKCHHANIGKGVSFLQHKYIRHRSVTEGGRSQQNPNSCDVIYEWPLKTKKGKPWANPMACCTSPWLASLQPQLQWRLQRPPRGQRGRRGSRCVRASASSFRPECPCDELLCWPPTKIFVLHFYCAPYKSNNLAEVTFVW